MAEQRSETFDVVVIGTGSAGKPLAGELAKAGRSVVAIERSLVGGECAYLACIPSKAMLLAAHAHHAEVVEHRAIAETDVAAFARAVGTRDRTVRHRDDAHALSGMEKEGITVVRGVATVTEPKTVSVATADGERILHWRTALVIATGSEAFLPPIDGLADAPTWTSSEALSGDELPNRLTILGGGAVGVELAQIFASFGSVVTMVETSPTVLPHEPAWVGEMVGEALGDLGVDVRGEWTVEKVSMVDGFARVQNSDGRFVDADRILVATGKKPVVAGMGFSVLGIAEKGPIEVDARLRVVTSSGVLPDVFAIGDVNAISPYTHTANYHARLVAAQILGHGYDADHVGIPRVVYTDPAVLCTGVTVEQAAAKGITALSAKFDVRSTSRSAVERTFDHHDHRPGGVELVADASTGVLIGAFAVGPEADSWAAELALAVRTRLTVHQLADALHAFPSWTEAIHPPARELAEKIPLH